MGTKRLPGFGTLVYACLKVFSYPFRLGRFRDDDVTLLEAPPDQNLSWRLSVLLSYLSKKVGGTRMSIRLTDGLRIIDGS
jgi:hypothetical protein